MSTVLVVDVQKAFIKESFSALPGRINSFIQAVQPSYVIGTGYENIPGSPCREFLNWTGCSTKEDMAFVGGLANLFDDVLYRSTYGLNPAQLDTLASVEGPIYVVGVDTDACVLSIALDLFDAGIKTYVIEDLCVSNGGTRLHEAGLLILRRNLGKDSVLPSDKVPCDWDTSLELARSLYPRPVKTTVQNSNN